MPDPHGQRYLNFLSAQAVLQASTGADGTKRAVTRGCEAAAGRIRPARWFLVIDPEEVPYIACLRGLLPRPSCVPSDGWMCPASAMDVRTGDVENGRAEEGGMH
eukprot:scaffold4173_cov117-Isochrysis_galbana.AAC.3